MNQYPLWKYLLIAAILLVSGLYSAPNLYGEDPALQISAARGAAMDASLEARVKQALSGAGVVAKASALSEGGLLVRLDSTEAQLKGQDVVKQELGDNYTVALNLAPATPGWLRAIDARPMYLGLDLRGGVHFLMEVDMDAVMQQTEERYVNDLRTLLRGEKVQYVSIARRAGGGVDVKFRDAAERVKARDVIGKNFRELALKELEGGEGYTLAATLNEQNLREVRRFAVQQNITTLRNRVNELGVAEPVIQQQGEGRIVVQLPGVQDTARAKEILGATATLEFRMVDGEHSVSDAVAGRVPPGSKLYRERNGNPVLLRKQVIITGDSITDAASTIDQRDGSPAVSISLDGKGARSMQNTTTENVGKPMAVVFIENKIETRHVNGEMVKTKKRVEEVINIATIREPFSKRFQITGLDSTKEARDLALLLRAGALSAPIDIIEERTVGPSLGQENIDKGFMSCVIGFVLVMVFMVARYKVFGVFASAAQLANLVLIIAALSLMQATLTLPGIAGIVLTVGMAVDANVLINERIREELRNGNSPLAAIEAGYQRALGTIADANITTLIAGVFLFTLGSGPVKGFAVVLCIGIVTSMFTALMGTRALVYLVYGGRRRVSKLAV